LISDPRNPVNIVKKIRFLRENGQKSRKTFSVTVSFMVKFNDQYL